jgi:tetratricopeptide (TPR) repeat protein
MTSTPPANSRHKSEAQVQASEDEWLARGRALTLSGELTAAQDVFSQAALCYPDSGEIRLGLAGLHWQSGRLAQAEALLRDWLTARPGDAGAAFLLTRLLRDQGRLQAAAAVMHGLFAHGPQDVDTVIDAVEMLDDYGRQQDAAAICENAIAAGSSDPRLHAYAGMLALQLGQFERVRERYDFALAHDANAVNWNIPLGLASLQRYNDAKHPDLGFFHELLERNELSDSTRTATLFALGKAYDDLGDFAKAADLLRQANMRSHAHSTWSRKLWKRNIDARLTATPSTISLPATSDWTPVFIVGVPRSGTTLLASLLARYPGVRNRGELGWLQIVAQRLSQTPEIQRKSLEDAARQYAVQLRQDDAAASWYIDKQPLNLLHVDLIMTLWPNARIIHCQRHPRDTALSLWTQSFHDSAHDYSYDFTDIAAVIHGCNRLAAHWVKRYPASVRSVSYEGLVNAPESTLEAISQWLGLPEQRLPAIGPDAQSISTASAWQARQPVHTRSDGRWRQYAPYIPELMRIPEH